MRTICVPAAVLVVVFLCAPAARAGQSAWPSSLGWDALAATAQTEEPGPDGPTWALPGESVGGPFAQGAWSLQAYGSATVGSHRGELYLGHVGVGWHALDNLSINLEAIFGGVDHGRFRDEDSSAIGFDLLLRWQFLQGRGWSVYADGGAGIIWTGDPFPRGGTHQNFTPQLGVGGTFRVVDELRLMGGVRWHHVSNAAKAGIDRNPGFDGAMLYFGVMVTF